MADYLANAKPPLSFEAEPPLLKILDFGGCTLLFNCYAVTNSTFSSISAGKPGLSICV
jgi:hypothetical protein